MASDKINTSDRNKTDRIKSYYQEMPQKTAMDPTFEWLCLKSHCIEHFKRFKNKCFSEHANIHCTKNEFFH